MNEKEYHKYACFCARQAKRGETQDINPRREGETKSAHVLRTLTKVEKEYFKRKFLNLQAEGCWIFGTGIETSRPAVQIRGTAVTASRIAWTLFKLSSPKDLFVCHKCDNPKCVNPDHLFLGTAKDNAQDMVSKGRQASQRKIKTHCKRGHQYTPENTIYQAKGRRCRTCKNLRRMWRRPILKAQGRNAYNA